MAKKLKYPYEQWKQEQQQKDSSRSPSPADLDHLERSNQLAASAASSESEQMTHSKSNLIHPNPFLEQNHPIGSFLVFSSYCFHILYTRALSTHTFGPRKKISNLINLIMKEIIER